MTDNQNYPKLVLPDYFDDGTLEEMEKRGYFHAEVELRDGSRFTFTFMHIIRLQQNYDAEVVEWGNICYAEPNLILIPEMTIERIEATIKLLWKRDFFSLIKSK